jgi:hypothetical protein
MSRGGSPFIESGNVKAETGNKKSMRTRAILLLLFLSGLLFPVSGFGQTPTPTPTATPVDSTFIDAQKTPSRFKSSRQNNAEIPHVIVDSIPSGGGGSGGDASAANQATQITAEQALLATAGAKADAKSTATDTTPISLVSILKQISASVQAPPPQAVTGPLTDTQLRATALPVAQTGAQYTVAITVATTDGSIAAGKHHIEFILSSDFAGTIAGAAIDPAIIGVYDPGTPPVGSTLAALVYTISAGNATITTW